MRIQILADVGGGLTLPINYNHLLAGVIYQYLTESDPEYASFLHDEGYRADKKRFRLFTFSQLMAAHRRITGEIIHFHSTLTWYVSSPVERFLMHFADTLLTEGHLSFGTRELEIKNVMVRRAPRFESEMQFRCLSPIVMTTKREREGKQTMHYCRVDDPELSRLICQNLIRKYRAIHHRTCANDALAIHFDQNYIQRRQGRVSRLVDYKGIKIRGIVCPFRASGSPALIRTGYECGFGDKNSAGFGMVDI